jgi:hypothetical protein
MLALSLVLKNIHFDDTDNFSMQIRHSILEMYLDVDLTITYRKEEFLP